MKRISFSFFLLTALSFSAAHAAPIDKISGSLFFEAQFPFKPEELSDNLLISRARLDFKGSWSQKFFYKIRLERPSSTINDFSKAVIPSAVISYTVFEDTLKLNVGRDAPGYSQAGTESQSYIERSLGVLEDSIGKKIGANISGVYDQTYGYSLGLWSTTARASIIDYSYSKIAIDSDEVPLDDTFIDQVTYNGNTPQVSFDQESVRFALGGRVNAVLLNRGLFSYGVGAGLQSLDVIVPLVVQSQDWTQIGNTNIAYHTTFEKRIAGTIDHSFGWKNFVINSAYHYFKYYRDNESSIAKTSVPADLNVFQRKNQASSGYLELSGLVVGDRYQINPSSGVVNKIIPDTNYGSLEVAMRFGYEYYYNAAAAQFIKNSFSSSPAVPFSFSKDPGYNLATITQDLEEDFIVRVKGWTFATSYAVNPSICLKGEYYHLKTSSKVNGIWTTLEKEQGLRFRSEFSF